MVAIKSIPVRSQSACLPYDDEKESMESINALLLAAFGQPLSPDTTGIYLISSNAGFHASLAFWREALDKGPGLANPERFPWTLANAPCGAISRAFGITGPNYTFNGSAQDIPGILHQLEFDFTQAVITQAWLIAIDFGENPKESTQMAAFKFSDVVQVQEVLDQFSDRFSVAEGLAAKALTIIISEVK